MTRFRRVAAFDVDGTLTTRDCVVPFLRRVAGTGAVVGGVARRPSRLAGAAVRRDRDALKSLAVGVAFTGRAVRDVELLGREFADHVHEHWMRDEIVDELERHRTRGHAVVLVSASFEAYLRPLAELIGADAVLGARLAVDEDGYLTGALDGPNCRGAEKVVRLHRWLAARGVPRSHAHITAYGDSAGDRELLADADVFHWIGRPPRERSR